MMVMKLCSSFVHAAKEHGAHFANTWKNAVSAKRTNASIVQTLHNVQVAIDHTHTNAHFTHVQIASHRTGVRIRAAPTVSFIFVRAVVMTILQIIAIAVRDISVKIAVT